VSRRRDGRVRTEPLSSARRRRSGVAMTVAAVSRRGSSRGTARDVHMGYEAEARRTE